MDEFADLTRQVIASHGLRDFFPTACYPGRRHFQTLAGFPDNLDAELPALDWAAKSAQPNEEFLVAFRIDANRFKIIRRIGPYSEDEIFAVR